MVPCAELLQGALWTYCVMLETQTILSTALHVRAPRCTLMGKAFAGAWIEPTEKLWLYDARPSLLWQSKNFMCIIKSLILPLFLLKYCMASQGLQFLPYAVWQVQQWTSIGPKCTQSILKWSQKSDQNPHRILVNGLCGIRIPRFKQHFYIFKLVEHRSEHRKFGVPSCWNLL